jgi:hypothetical protein
MDLDENYTSNPDQPQEHHDTNRDIQISFFSTLLILFATTVTKVAVIITSHSSSSLHPTMQTTRIAPSIMRALKLNRDAMFPHSQHCASINVGSSDET